MGRFDGRVALVTGGARGMGAAHVRELVDAGASVVFGDVLDEQGEALAAELGERARYIHHDVSDQDGWTAAVRTATETFGRLDILVNNAGILLYRTITDMTPEEFRKIIDVNLMGTWLGIKSVAEPMRQSGGGSIVNVSSIEGYIGAAGLSAYSASKFGIRGVTKATARELARDGIRVNSIHPGAIDTDMMRDPDIAAHVDGEAFFRAMPMPRAAEPREVSRAVLFLASEDSSYCTGTEIVIDGGILTGAGY